MKQSKTITAMPITMLHTHKNTSIILHPNRQLGLSEQQGVLH
jgi:hypothetical protein